MALASAAASAGGSGRGSDEGALAVPTQGTETRADTGWSSAIPTPENRTGVGANLSTATYTHRAGVGTLQEHCS